MVLRPGEAPVRVSEGGWVWVSVCVLVCTCDALEVCMCVPACFCPLISPVPLSVTVPTVIWMRVPHCIALHVSV